VAVLAIPRVDRSPLTTPVWYDYDGTRFRVQVEATSAKAKALARTSTLPVSLTIQSEVPPYRYAIVHGRATLHANDQPGLRRRLARRYFGRLVGDMYVAEEEKRGVDDRALQVIEIVPERTVAHDFGPEAGVVGRLYFAIYRWLRPTPA
jgi:nitroimidazol reductase NimA-like FMN-containing flavoprotein (pyridoxamine 5'-phosphate oxidase superfamily)